MLLNDKKDVTDVVLVTPNDYRNVAAYHKTLVKALGVYTNDPQYTLNLKDWLQGMSLDINPSITTAVKELTSTKFVHSADPLPAMDMAITVTARPRNDQNGIATTIGVVTAVFFPESFNAPYDVSEEMYMPLVRITGITTAFYDVTITTLLEVLAIDYWNNKMKWLKSFYDFSKGAPNLGNLVSKDGELYRVESDKALGTLVFSPQHTCFVSPNPVPVIDVVAGRMNGNLIPLVTSSNPARSAWARKRIANFFNVQIMGQEGKAIDTVTAENMPQMFLKEIGVEYIGNITNGQFDTRSITYLQQLAVGVRNTHPALVGLKRIARPPEEKYANLGSLQRGYVSDPMFISFIWSVNPAFIEMVIKQISMSGITINDLGSDTDRSEYQSPISGFTLNTSITSHVQGGATNRRDIQI
jgi:hypothetical protein